MADTFSQKQYWLQVGNAAWRKVSSGEYVAKKREGKLSDLGCSGPGSTFFYEKPGEPQVRGVIRRLKDGPPPEDF